MVVVFVCNDQRSWQCQSYKVVVVAAVTLVVFAMALAVIVFVIDSCR